MTADLPLDYEKIALEVWRAKERARDQEVWRQHNAEWAKINEMGEAAYLAEQRRVAEEQTARTGVPHVPRGICGPPGPRGIPGNFTQLIRELGEMLPFARAALDEAEAEARRRQAGC